MKRFIFALFIFLIGISFFAFPHVSFAYQTNLQYNDILADASEPEPSIDYDLPYSGMLPDSPFYIIKKARDHIHVFFTRDHIKKSELLLKVADKKVSMAQQLADKEKWDLVVETLQDSQADSEQMISSMLKRAMKNMKR